MYGIQPPFFASGGEEGGPIAQTTWADFGKQRNYPCINALPHLLQEGTYKREHDHDDRVRGNREHFRVPIRSTWIYRPVPGD